MLSLLDVSKFLDCPLKVSFSKTTIPSFSFKELLFSEFINEALLYKAKNNSLTVGAGSAIFNRAWHKVKTKNSSLALSNGDKALLQLSRYAIYAIEFLNSIGEVISLNDSIVVQFKDVELEATIDSVSRSTDGTIHVLFKYWGSQYFSNHENYFFITILKYIAKYYLKELSTVKYCIHLYKVATGKFYSFYQDIDMRKTKTLLQNFCKSLTTSFPDYPNNSVGTCMRCEFKLDCIWSIL